MEDTEKIRVQSKANLDLLLQRLQKFKIRHSDEAVEMALDALPVYHCVPEANIIEVIKAQELKVKNKIVVGEHTNLSTDFFQGFGNHLSMSVGTPWVEYGPFAFAFGFEKIHDDSLCFCDDPWQWDAGKFQNNVLVKSDFLIYAKELLKRNVYRINSKHYVALPWKKDLHKLGERNFKKWEIKQAANLSILDADEFFVWNNADRMVYLFVKLFYNWPMFLIGMGILALVIWGYLR